MDAKINDLFTPWKIGNLEIKNRIVLSPMGGTSLFSWKEMGGSHFDKEAAKFFLERARNNVGLIIPGTTLMRDPLFGRWLWENDKVFDEIKGFMDEIHHAGAKLFIQLAAGMGRAWAMSDQKSPIRRGSLVRKMAKPFIDTKYHMASSSVLPSCWAPGVMTREMTVSEIREIVDAFAKTAALCQKAGVDGIEVHALHEGYLLDQFTMSYTNYRRDEYGGSFENRYRFPVEIVQAIKAACGPDFPVSVRFSVRSMMKDFGIGAVPGEKFWEVGRGLRESEKAARYLQDAGYDMINADNGTHDSWYWSHPPMYMPQNCNLEDVSHIKQFVDIPVVCAGRMDPEVASNAIAEGRIDAVGIARQFLTDPEWVTKLMRNRARDIRPCIGCQAGCFHSVSQKGRAHNREPSSSRGIARCALNPQTMQSEKYKLVPAKKQKQIGVIGGGIGGMEAAIVCAKRGHRVTIYEKSNRLGGAFIAAGAMSFKEKHRELLKWYEQEISNHSITVKLGTLIEENDTPMDEEFIIATGAIPNRPNIPGVELGIDAKDFLLGKRRLGDKVVIIGGGLTGCEIAYELYRRGKHPILVEQRQGIVASSEVCPANSSYLRDFFAANQVPVHLQTTATEIHTDGVTVTDKFGRFQKIHADSVILATGYRPAPLNLRYGRCHLVGDCSQIGNLRSVIWQAWDVAMKL